MEKRNQASKIKLADFLAKNPPNKLTPKEEELEIEKGVGMIDERLNALVEYIGRELTDDEEVAVMDIVEELTPMGKDGKFLVDMAPFDYAWQIYQAKKDDKFLESFGQLEIDGN